MFDKLKQLKQLKDLQKQLSQEILEVEKEGIKVSINGNIEIQNIQLNTTLEKERQEKILKDCLNDVVRKMQMKLAQKMGQLSGLGF